MQSRLALLCSLLSLVLAASLYGARPSQAGGFAPAQSGWITVTKTADEARASNTTTTADSALTFAVAANTKYRFRGVVAFTTSDAGNFKWALTGPPSPTKVVTCYTSAFAGTTPATTLVSAAYPSAAFNVGSTTGPDPNLLIVDGVVHNVSAGDVYFGWAQDTSNVANTTVHAGSYLEYKVVQ